MVEDTYPTIFFRNQQEAESFTNRDLNLIEVYRSACPALARGYLDLLEQLKLSDKLIEERNRVLERLKCDVHGQCVPGALEKIDIMESRYKNVLPPSLGKYDHAKLIALSDDYMKMKARCEKLEAQLKVAVDGLYSLSGTSCCQSCASCHACDALSIVRKIEALDRDTGKEG